jgi:hypothetical protein
MFRRRHSAVVARSLFGSIGARRSCVRHADRPKTSLEGFGRVQQPLGGVVHLVRAVAVELLVPVVERPVDGERRGLRIERGGERELQTAAGATLIVSTFSFHAA